MKNAIRWSRQASCLALLILLVACPRLLPPPSSVHAPARSVIASDRHALAGRIAPARLDRSRQVQSTLAEIANAATVSLIRTDNGTTVASSRTTSDGRFLLTFGATFRPDPNLIYILEAVKGLGAGGNPNRAGAAAARVRTLVKWDGQWHSITSGTIVIALSTTALSTISSLRAYAGSPVDESALIGSVTVATDSAPDVFVPGSSGVAPGEYDQVLPLVADTIAIDADPIASIVYNSTTGNYSTIQSDVGIANVNPGSGRIGDTITITGTNFVSDLSQLSVSFNGVPAVEITRNILGTELTARVPVGATSGPLSVKVGGLVFGAGKFRVLSWDGHTPFDAAGNFYLAGYANDAIFRLDPGGTLTLWAQGGGLDGPRSVTVGPDDYVYVANYDGNTISRISPSGLVETYATGGGLNAPWGLVLQTDGTMLVANGDNTVLHVASSSLPVTPAVYVASGAFNRPAGLALAQNGDLYVANWNGNSVCTVASGSLAVSTILSGLAEPASLAFDSTGNLYIADHGNNAVQLYSTSGDLTTFTASVGTHAGPTAVACDPAGTLYIGNWDSHTIYSVNPQGGIRDLALAPQRPWGITAAANNDLYLTVNNSLRRWQGRPLEGRVYRVRYNGGNYGPFEVVLDGFNEPSAAAFDSSGSLYVADRGAQRIYTADPDTGARQIWLSGITSTSQMTFDANDNLYLARWIDTPQKITPGKTITTPFSGLSLQGGAYDAANNLYLTSAGGNLSRVAPDGTTAVLASGLGAPAGIVFDGTRLLVAEYGADRIGTFSLAGVRGSDLFAGAPLNGPSGLAISGGDLYVSNFKDAVIVRLPLSGGSSTTWATAPSSLRDIVITGGSMYGTRWDNSSIAQIDLATPTTQNPNFATLPTQGDMNLLINPWGIATDGTNLYVTAGNDETTRLNAGWSGIYRIPLTAPTPARIRSESSHLSDILLSPGGGLTSVNYNSRGLNGYAARRTDSDGNNPTSLGSYLYRTAGIAFDGLDGIYITAWYGTLSLYANRLSTVDGSWTRAADLYSIGAVNFPIHADRTNQDLYVGSHNGLFRYSKTGTLLASYSGTGQATGAWRAPNGDVIGCAVQSAVESVPLYRIPAGTTAASVMTNWPYRPAF